MTVLKIKNSTVAGRKPAADALETAELAINLVDKKLFTKDAAGNIIQLGAGGEVPSGDTDGRPDAPTVGELYYDTDEAALLYWDGSAWQEVGSGSQTLINTSAPNPDDYEAGTLWGIATQQQRCLCAV